MLQLSDQEAVANGAQKFVYRHPESSGQLIKVLNPNYIRHINQTWPLSTRLRRLPYYWLYAYELVEHMAVRDQNVADNQFIQKIIGLVDTDLGMGLVVEAVTKRNGELADSLSQLINDRQYNEMHHAALLQLIDWVNDNYVIIRDLTTRNVVWNEEGGNFVIIDGIGSRNLPSFRMISKRYNARSNRKRTNKLREKVKRQAKKNNLVIPPL